MNKFILSIIVVIIGIADASSQTKQAFLAAAEEAMGNKNYYAALTYYNEALEFDAKDVDVLKNSAEAARMFNSYKIAADRYSYLIDTLAYTGDSLMVYHLANMHQRLGAYDKATHYYDLFLSESGKEGEYFTERAKLEKEASVWASSRIKELDENVTVNRLETSVNSNYSDFGAHADGDKLYFSSMRFLEENQLVVPSRSISKILLSNESIEPLESDLNNRDLSVANSTFNLDKTKLFYTVCEYKNDNDLRCDIYWASVVADSITEEQRLPSPLNDINFTNTQPYFGRDPITNNEVLYFVSDRPGGKGKLDIWYSEYDKKLGFSIPVNLEELNTAEDDITPSYQLSTHTLYFSSNGKLGFGGYDIFKSINANGKFNQAEILPAPYNSSFHDIYYNVSEDGTTAYFSSNRTGANYVDAILQSCCYDIYKADIEPLIINLNALTYDKTTGKNLNGATVKLIDLGSGLVVGEVKSDDSNEHLFDLIQGKEYMIVAEKPDYRSDTVMYSTMNMKKSEAVTKKLYLDTDLVSLDAFTFDQETKDALAGATITIEDLTDPSNPKLIATNIKGNDFHFPLLKNKTYRINAERNGYTPVSETIDTRGVSGKISKNIYLSKFNLERLLPLALYFDNDQPNPDSKSTASTLIYGDLVSNYMARKPTFINNYSKGTKGEEKQSSQARMETFFEGDIRGGYDRFSIFMDELIKVLNAGQKVEITIRGYASPRFSIKYNLVLGQRRIQTVMNDMKRYKNGALAGYLKNKSLIMTEISYGEELAPIDIIDNLNDERGSIYSLRASKERRVEVISAKAK